MIGRKISQNNKFVLFSCIKLVKSAMNQENPNLKFDIPAEVAIDG